MYIRNKNIVVRKILPSYFLVDITKCYNNEDEKMFITDEIGNAMWDSIADGDVFEDVLNKFVIKLADVNDEAMITTIKNDLKEYLEALKRQGNLFEV